MREIAIDGRRIADDTRAYLIPDDFGDCDLPPFRWVDLLVPEVFRRFGSRISNKFWSRSDDDA